MLVRRGVREILIENGRANGVVMEGGKTIRAPCIISACGAKNTCKILGPKHIPPSMARECEAAESSDTFTYLCLGFDASPEVLGLPSHNIWRMPADTYDDFDKMILAFQDDPEHAPIPVYASFPSTKDSEFDQRFPGKATAEIVIAGPTYKYLSQWESTKWGHRDQEYLEFKSMIEERVLEEFLYRYFPQTRDHVVSSSVGTGLSFNHFLASHKGAPYALKPNACRFSANDWLRPELPIPGLYMTGTDITFPGIAGAVGAGILTAMSVVGYGSIFDALSGRNIVEDLWHLDAAQQSEYSQRSKKHSTS